jgi:toxoflavin synthase
MMQIGKDIEEKAGRNGRIRWHLADASKPLSEQATDLRATGKYDIVMANWVFDHAHSVEDLTGMWENIVASLKSGGRFLGIRVIRPGIWADHVKEGKYGAKYDDIADIPGGVKCRVILMTDPPFSFGGTMMRDSYDMINKIPQELGMENFEAIPAEDMEIVKGDLEFWKEHLEEPLFSVITATKI